MQLEWLATEHYRLHRVEEWPDSPRKEATLAAIHDLVARSAIERRNAGVRDLQQPQAPNPRPALS